MSGRKIGEVILDVADVSLSFGGVKALQNISFNVREHEIRAIIGPNGAGKSSMLNVVNGVYTPQQGRITFRGKERGRMDPHDAAALGIGRTFQVVKPLARMTVLDNVTASAFCRVNTIKEAKEEALRVLGFCNLLNEKEKQAKSLPIGGRKRLEIARALATKPELLLLDETAAGLNPSELDEAIDLIKKIRDSGVTILIVEHIMKVIMTISDRIHAINFGQTIAQGTPKEVADNRAVIEAYLGEEYAQG